MAELPVCSYYFEIMLSYINTMKPQFGILDFGIIFSFGILLCTADRNFE